MNSIAFMTRFQGMEGKALNGNTVDGLIVVEVNDVGSEPNLYVVCKGNKKIYKGIVDDSGVFQELDLDAKLAKIKADADAAEAKAKAKADARALMEASTVYAIETSCGGNDACGGGCGAPLSATKVSKEYFNGIKGGIFSRFENFRNDELPGELYRAQEEGVLCVKYAYRPCSACRRSC